MLRSYFYRLKNRAEEAHFVTLTLTDFAAPIMVHSLLGGHFAALLHSRYHSLGGCDCKEHLQASDAQGQTLRGAGRAAATAAANAEV